jgi:hypothetical protein
MGDLAWLNQKKQHATMAQQTKNVLMLLVIPDWFLLTILSMWTLKIASILERGVEDSLAFSKRGSTMTSNKGVR